MSPLVRWVVGMTVALIVGGFVTGAFLGLLRRYMGISDV